ncbi:hypothetical protein GP486_005336 [Trichoglossum hirsutum]|uniref:BZIP domain-containing protein n=1 Tax=Trichoglossum hirsutum TaxID=265104 RepID=A0A9P8L9B8_9PEZI|nr:hypothetical protein GP486_005336 [Trichoglossum hirsutum]
MKSTHPTPSSSASSSSSTHAQCLDPLDLYINYDLYPSPSLSPPSSARSSSSSSSSQASATANPNNTLLPPGQSFGSNFSGPSHRYELHQQQTGIPAEAIAKTLAVNPAGKMYNQIGYGLSDAFFDSTDLNTEEDLIDFGAASVPFSSSDMDMEYDSPPSGDVPPSLFLPEQSSSASSEYINPSAIEEESTDNLSTSNIGRLYPGHHQQQAALAKAQAEQQKQQTVQLQKQGQRPATGQDTSKKPNRSQRAAAQQPADPIVEDRISRLLSSMRQSSVATSDDDGSSSTGMLPHISKVKKEEEDMDEDERLLASEEGKKLSSKERRQLRNKVSARAFRSRRKGKLMIEFSLKGSDANASEEYIGQLEAEVAAKANEANDLRMQNRALMEENTRLSDLTRMLLSSPSFSNFLDALSPVNGRPAPVDSTERSSTSKASRQAENQTPNPPKDANPYAAQHHVGMALVPDNNIDFSMTELNNNNWATGYLPGTWGANQPQVFSVFELPECPAVDQIDTKALSGKSSSFTSESFSSDEAKVEAPMVERMPVIEEQNEKVNAASPVKPEAGLDESDPAFSLFEDSPAAEVVEAKSDFAPVKELLQGITVGKTPHFELITINQDRNVDAVDMDLFLRLCDSTEAALRRIDGLTKGL